MSALSDAIDSVDAALSAASKVFTDEYPPGKECVFLWSDGIYHSGEVQQYSLVKQFRAIVRSDTTKKSYVVSAHMLVAGEKYNGQ